MEHVLLTVSLNIDSLIKILVAEVKAVFQTGVVAQWGVLAPLLRVFNGSKKRKGNLEAWGMLCI